MEMPIGAMPTRRRGYGEEASARSWAIGGALVGLVIALLGFALISLLRMDWSGALGRRRPRRRRHRAGRRPRPERPGRLPAVG